MNKKDVSFADFIIVFRKKWWLILLCGLIGAVCVGVFSIKTYTPEYKSTVTFYVVNQKSGADSSANEDVNSVNWALKVINSYSTLIHTNKFSERICQSYKELFPEDHIIDKYSARQIKTMIEVSIVENTNLFRVYLKTSVPEFSLHLAKCVESITPTFIQEISGNDNPLTIADEGVLPGLPDNSNHLSRNTLIGFVFCALIVYIILFLIDLFDVRIKNEEDIMNNYTLPILGLVPTFEAPMNRKKAYKYGN